jgi:hypothetical protein
MKARMGRLWRRARGRADEDRPAPPSPDPRSVAAGSEVLELTEAPADGPPEQPILLLPAGPRTVHVGELLPAPRRWPLSVVRLPSVPKRAILAAGLCAGLAAPTVTRALATRLLLGKAAVRPESVIEVTRIVYSGPMTTGAVAAITRALLAGRR